MWRFTFALLVIILFGSIMVGQLFDTLTQPQSAQSISPEQQNLLDQINLLQQALASGISVTQLPDWLALSSANSPIRYELQSLIDYPLPEPLLSQIQAKGAVFLESTDGLTAYTLITPQTALLVTQKIHTQSALTPWLLTLGFYSVLLALVVVFLTPFLLRVYRLRNAAIQFGKGQLHTRLAVGSLWYLKDIEQHFNLMAERIENLMNNIRLLSGGMSHELRTPLAKIRMGLDTLSETQDAALRIKYEKRINQNIDDMEMLINKLLHFARMQHSLDSATKSPIDLAAVLRQLCEKNDDHRLSLNIAADNYVILGNEYYVSLLLSNLIVNALKHCKQTVQLSLSQTKSTITLSVNDDGAGIKPADIDKIFKPFVRLGKQTDSSKDGFGIGLALVELITHWLNGEIKVSVCATLGGASFVLTLPRAAQQNRGKA